MVDHTDPNVLRFKARSFSSFAEDPFAPPTVLVSQLALCLTHATNDMNTIDLGTCDRLELLSPNAFEETDFTPRTGRFINCRGVRVVENCTKLPANAY